METIEIEEEELGEVRLLSGGGGGRSEGKRDEARFPSRPILRFNLHHFDQCPCAMRSSWDAIVAQGGDDSRLGPCWSSLRRGDSSQVGQDRDRDRLDLVFFRVFGHRSSFVVDLGLGWYWTVGVLVDLGL